MPRPRHWISPMWTGREGQGAPKREQMSVPPVMDESCTVGGKELYTYSKEAGGSTDPVDLISLNFDRLTWFSTISLVV